MIIQNEYIQECKKTAFSSLLQKFNWKPYLKFIHVIIRYPEWDNNVDILQYVENLNLLRHDSNTYFVFDACQEGFSPFRKFFFSNLYRSCDKHRIPYKKIIFVSSNMKDVENLENYNDQNNIVCGIHVFSFLTYKQTIQEIVQEDFGTEFNETLAYDYFKRQCYNEYTGTPGISLSRVNREHRSLAHFLLYTNNLEKDFKISQNTLTAEQINYTKQHYPLNYNFEKWAETLPRTIDTENFDQSQKIELNTNLHNSSIFQIVNETHVKTWKNTSLFFSEKTFRPIALMQPFLIFGQPGCNKKLEQFGFKLFYDVFDYEFDTIEDTKKRYLAIIDNCKRVITDLEKKSIKQQIDWRFKNKETLQHNFSILMDQNYFKKDLENLIEKL